MIADLRVEFPEIPIAHLAQRVGRSTATVRIWLKQPRYQSYENWVFEQKKAQWSPWERASKADVAETIQEFSGEMLERLLVIAETTEDEKLAASLAQDWLDRGGYGARNKGASGLQVILTEEAIAMLLQRSAESHGTVIVGTGKSEGAQ